MLGKECYETRCKNGDNVATYGESRRKMGRRKRGLHRFWSWNLEVGQGPLGLGRRVHIDDIE